MGSLSLRLRGLARFAGPPVTSKSAPAFTLASLACQHVNDWAVAVAVACVALQEVTNR